MKKFTALILCFIISFSLIGCGSSNDSADKRFTEKNPPELEGNWYLDGDKTNKSYIEFTKDSFQLYKSLIPGRKPVSMGKQKYELKMDDGKIAGEKILRIEPFFASNPSIKDAEFYLYPVLGGDALVRIIYDEYQVFVREDIIGKSRGVRARAYAAMLSSSLSSEDFKLEMVFSPFDFKVYKEDGKTETASGIWSVNEKNEVTIKYDDGGKQTFSLKGYSDKGVKIKKFSKVFKPTSDINYNP